MAQLPVCVRDVTPMNQLGVSVRDVTPMAQMGGLCEDTDPMHEAAGPGMFLAWQVSSSLPWSSYSGTHTAVNRIV